jgi:hypothetical protein
MTSVKYTNKKVKKILLICGIVALVIALVATGIYLVIRNGVFYKKEDTAGNSYAMSAEMKAVMNESELHKGYMLSRTTKLLSEDRVTEPWVLSWYMLPGTTRSVPAMESAYVDTFDQVLLLESYIEEGKRSKAESLIKSIDSSLTDESGYLLSFRKADELITSERTKEEHNDSLEEQSYLLLNDPPVSMKATTRYLRALLDFYDKWGSKKTLEKIETLSELVFGADGKKSYRAADQAAKPTPIPVTEKSLVTPIPEDDADKDEGNILVGVSGTELSAMDLDAMRRAAVLFPKYQEKYEAVLKTVKDGKISTTLPLYAWMCTDEGEYTYYTGSAGDVELVPSLYVMVYLAETGNLDAEGYAWVSEQIYNTGFLYTSYDMISGEATSATEAMDAYPLVMYLAIIKGDDNLFTMTYQAMMRHYATLSTSPALYTFYREFEDSRYAVYARENLLMELILK